MENLVDHNRDSLGEFEQFTDALELIVPVLWFDNYHIAVQLTNPCAPYSVSIDILNNAFTLDVTLD